MISCIQQDHLMPQVIGGLDSLSADPYPTLTEVATLAIYRARLTREELLYASTMHSNEMRCLWRGDNGLEWLEPNIEAMIALLCPGARRKRDAIIPPELEGPYAWLTEGRKIAAPGHFDDAIQEKKSRLAAMSDIEALEFARSEAQRSRAAQEIVNERTRRVYELISNLVAEGQIVLKARRVYRHEDVLVQRPPLSDNHSDLSPNDIIADIGHDLFENTLDLEPPRSDAAVLEYINRRKRQELDLRIDWSDVRLPRLHAQLVIDRFALDAARDETSESKCRAWLEGLMRNSPQHRPKPRRDFFAEAKELYPGLSRRAFDRAWNEGKRVTGAKWDAAGRPKVQHRQ